MLISVLGFVVKVKLLTVTFVDYCGRLFRDSFSDRKIIIASLLIYTCQKILPDKILAQRNNHEWNLVQRYLKIYFDTLSALSISRERKCH